MEYIEISSHNSIAALPSVTAQDLENISCILIFSRQQRENEQEYYQGVVGFQGKFLYAKNLEEARLQVISGRGFMPSEGAKQARNFGTPISRISLYRGRKQIIRNYCAFWKKDNSVYYVEEFAEMLKSNLNHDICCKGCPVDAGRLCVSIIISQKEFKQILMELCVQLW